MPDKLNNERLLHSLKTAFACLLGYAITKSAKFPVEQWIVVSIIVVMCAQINVGSMLQKSYMRFLGTLSGTIIAIIAVFLFHDQHLALGIVVAGAAMVFSYVATSDKPYSDAGTLGAVTTAIILIGHDPTFLTAISRFLEISVGIVIAALVSQFVLPIHARYHLRRLQAKTLRQLRDYYKAVLMSGEKIIEEPQVQELDETLVTSLNAQRKLAKESHRETLGHFDLKLFQRLLWCEKEILRCISFMRYVNEFSSEDRVLLNNCLPLHHFNETICNLLTQMAIAIQTKSTTKITVPEWKPMVKALDEDRARMPSHEFFYLGGILFVTQILLRRLAELTALIKEIN